MITPISKSIYKSQQFNYRNIVNILVSKTPYLSFTTLPSDISNFFEINNVSGDGNCFFHAFKESLEDKGIIIDDFNDLKGIRAKLVVKFEDYKKTNNETYNKIYNSLDLENDFKKHYYIDINFGILIGLMYNIDIYVYRDSYYKGFLSSKTLYKFFNNDTIDNNIVRIEAINNRFKRNTIYLYFSGSHFQWLKPKIDISKITKYYEVKNFTNINDVVEKFNIEDYIELKYMFNTEKNKIMKYKYNYKDLSNEEEEINSEDIKMYEIVLSNDNPNNKTLIWLINKFFEQNSNKSIIYNMDIDVKISNSYNYIKELLKHITEEVYMDVQSGGGKIKNKYIRLKRRIRSIMNKRKKRKI
jgi:hypothetical protein